MTAAAEHGAPRDLPRRTADTIARLTAPVVDAWVATASTDGRAGHPYMVPLSLAWLDDRAVLALEGRSRTARNLTDSGRARLGVGGTRDVVLIDAVLERTAAVAEAPELAARYAARSDWDPRQAGDNYVLMVLRPERVQAWREVDEFEGRTLMRAGRWLSPGP